MARINEWHESSNSAKITGFLDSAHGRYADPQFEVFLKKQLLAAERGDCRVTTYVSIRQSRPRNFFAMMCVSAHARS